MPAWGYPPVVGSLAQQVQQYNVNITLNTNGTTNYLADKWWIANLNQQYQLLNHQTAFATNYQTFGNYQQAFYQPITLTGDPITLYTGTGGKPDKHEMLKARIRARLDDRAAMRAKALLLEHLDDQQRKEYEEKQYFHVLSQGGRLYRIRRGSAGNVYSIGLDGNEEHKFCIHARDTVPTEDNMLAQLLLLRFDEQQFLATANRHW